MKKRFSRGYNELRVSTKLLTEAKNGGKVRRGVNCKHTHAHTRKLDTGICAEKQLNRQTDQVLCLHTVPPQLMEASGWSRRGLAHLLTATVCLISLGLHKY